MLQQYMTRIDRWRYKVVSTYCVNSVLDIGCGKKGLMQYIAPDKYVGCDLAGGDLLCSAYDLPFKDRAFDTVVLGEILEHLGNPLIAIKQASMLADKRVIVTVPNDYSLVRLIRLMIGREVEIEQEHLLSFNCWNLARLFELAGFEVRESFCFPLRVQCLPEIPLKSRFGYWLFSIADRVE
ncbi:MAG: methyltransferase domain-containing protein [Thermodesulfobacteriota bacterium]|nr:methyltransferase domain-containing protein [Thermodesulfobacteriota bacterium]